MWCIHRIPKSRTHVSDLKDTAYWEKSTSGLLIITFP